VYAWPVKLIQYDDGVHWNVLDARIRFDAVYRSIFGGNFGTGNAPQYPFALDGGRWNEKRPAPVWPNNVWLRLRRIGNTFYGYHSSDGINWGVNNGPGSDFVTHPYIMEGCSNVMYVGFQNADSLLDTTGIGLMLLHVPRRFHAWITAALLVGYWLLMTLVPVPGLAAGVLEEDRNLATWIDLSILGSHGYRHSVPGGFTTHHGFFLPIMTFIMNTLKVHGSRKER